VKLEGTLETVPLRELLDMIVYSSVTGLLNLYAGALIGHVYVRDGSLYHCEYNGAEGVEGLACLLELSQAGFSFIRDCVSDRESLWGDTTYHLQTAERLARRWQGVRPYVPNLSLVPVLLVSFEAALRRVGPAHRQVLDRIDGLHTIKAITEDLGWAEIEVAEVIAQMCLDSLIDVQREVEARSAVAEHQRGSLFERLLVRPGDAGSRQPAERPGLSSEELVLRVLRS
jgi:Domain of unknown function (DUF4388)